MNMAMVLVIAAAGLIAYVNGANDVSKGIATLIGSGVTDSRRALLWGTVWTGLGGLAAAALAKAMVTTFGKGLLPAHAPGADAAIAIIVGAALCVAIASRLGLPVSTTHAIVGSVAGVAPIAYGIGGVNWLAFAGKIAVPLLLSPLLALAAVRATLGLWRVLAGTDDAADCACLHVENTPVVAATSYGAMALPAQGAVSLWLSIGDQKHCLDAHPHAYRITMDHFHWLTSAAASFARGLNDAPKMAALALGAALLINQTAAIEPLVFLLISLSMAAGSWLSGRRVTGVLAEDITAMSGREGFVANLVTAALVGPGAALGLPMSTTHVSSAAIAGLGLGGDLNRRTLRRILLAWVGTLPAAGVLAIGVYGILKATGAALP